MHSFYKFSGELGTVNFAHSTSKVSGDGDNLMKKDFLKEHLITEHLIILSIEELTQGNTYVQGLSHPESLIQMFDPRVMVLNNIMFTFHREGLYVIENKTKESWYWNANSFEKT